MPLLHKKLSVIVFWLTSTQLQLIRWLLDWLVAALLTDLLTSLLTSLLTNWLANWFNYWLARLQNSPYFCVFKYARVVKQKVWNEAENRERDLGRDAKNMFFFLSPHRPYGHVRLACFARVRLLWHALPISSLILRKNPTVLQSTGWLTDWQTVADRLLD